MVYTEHLYITDEGTIVGISEDFVDIYTDEEHEQLMEEHKIVWANEYSSFPENSEIGDCGEIILDEPIKDWSNLSEIEDKTPYSLKEYLGMGDVDEMLRMVPVVEDMSKYGYAEHMIQIRNPWEDGAAITRGINYEFDGIEKYKEIEEQYGYCSKDRFIDTIITDLDYVGQYQDKYADWQKNIIAEQLDYVYYDLEHEISKERYDER